MAVAAGNENLTLAEHELAACRPVQSAGGRKLRAFCPIHGSDNQRSLSVDVATGRFQCYACGAWGYMDWARERWVAERKQERPAQQRRRPMTAQHSTRTIRPKVEAAPKTRPDLADKLREFQNALPGSLGEEYLKRRGISLELAQQYGVGYAAGNTWPGRPWKWGRVVFPLTDADGRLISLYGRAVGSNEKVPKMQRHDILSGDKGYFGGAALKRGEGPLFVCEGPFDALALAAAGCERVTAILGVKGWRWPWARDVKEIVLALDGDRAGQEAWKQLARAAWLRGMQVYFLPPKAYGGHKDASEAWVAGALRIGDIPRPKEEGEGWHFVDSDTLGERLIVATSDEAAARAPKGYVVYTPAEIDMLRGCSVEALRQVHAAKRLTAGALVAVNGRSGPKKRARGSPTNRSARNNPMNDQKPTP